MSKVDGSAVRSILRELMSRTDAGINAAAAITTDGMMIASMIQSTTDPDRFGAMCASLLALAERAITEIERGELTQLMVEGTNGAVLLVQAGPDAVLAVSTEPGALIGNIFLQTRQTADRLHTYLAENAGV